MLTKFLRTKSGFGLIVITMGALACLLTKVSYDYLHLERNKVYLEQLSQRLLLRAELAADYAVISLNEADSQGYSNCSTQSFDKLVDMLYSRGNLKDFAVLGPMGMVKCSVLGGLRPDFLQDVSENQKFSTLNDDIEFIKMGEEHQGQIGVNWQFDGYSILAVMNIDALLFDIFPADWRDNSIAKISFDDSNLIGTRVKQTENSDVEYFGYMAKSQRYPLMTDLSVSKPALAAHNRQSEGVILWGGTIIGLVFGLLLAQILGRPENPIAEISRAIDNDEFVPFVQPLFDLQNRKIIGGEALTRWIKADGSLVPPSKFIDLAEDSGLIVPMTRSIIRQTLHQVGNILELDRSLKIAFNITPDDLLSDGFSAQMLSLVKGSKVHAQQIVFEITERQEIGNSDKAKQVIDALKKLGFRVALDDTGTGHNGLSYIQDLQADIIKIDKKFVDFVADGEGNYIVEMLVRLAKRMKMQTVAEGIETEDQAMALQKLGVDQGQGYLVAKPMPPVEFCEQLAKQIKA